MIRSQHCLRSDEATAMEIGSTGRDGAPQRDLQSGRTLPPGNDHRSSRSLGVVVAVAVAIVSSTSCDASREPRRVELVPPATALPLPSARAAALPLPSARATALPLPSARAAAPVGTTAEDLTYDPLALTLFAIDVETRLAFMCGLPRSKVFFKYNSSKLLPGAKEILDRIATCARTGPAKGQALLVVGRTDSAGSDRDNQKLGMSRAESVAKYLGELGVEHARVETVSKGEDAADETFPGNWPYDRKVTVRLQPVAGLVAPRARQEMTDPQIEDAVDHLLRVDSALLDKPFDAKVNQGIVTLSGTANHLLASGRAVKLAQTIRGVRGVVNTIVLKIPFRSDEHLRQDVVLALLFDAATDAYELVPAVKDGVVTLSGTSQSYLEKRLAVHVARGVKGVREVKDHITLKMTSSRLDREIAAEVKRAIAINVWLDRSFITTGVKNGVVTLSGVVGSSAQRDLASELAWTAGVKSVTAEGLKIEPWAMLSGQRRGSTATRSNPQLVKAVKDAFINDPRVVPFSLGVQVDSGVVTLTGVVDSLKAKRSAEQDAVNTVGVRQVNNLLKVSPAKPIGDDELARKVDAALRRDPVVDGHAIGVKAKSGVVTLTGSVNSYFQASQAVDIASRARGAVDVTSQLTVGFPTLAHYDLGYAPAWAFPTPYYSLWSTKPRDHSWTRVSDATLRNNVEGELYWSPFVDLFQVIVKAAQGVVTLTGTVDSWSQVRAATNNAFAGGALEVKNELKVRL